MKNNRATPKDLTDEASAANANAKNKAAAKRRAADKKAAAKKNAEEAAAKKKSAVADKARAEADEASAAAEAATDEAEAAAIEAAEAAAADDAEEAEAAAANAAVAADEAAANAAEEAAEDGDEPAPVVLPKVGDRVICKYLANGGTTERTTGKVTKVPKDPTDDLEAEVVISGKRSRMMFSPLGTSGACFVWLAQATEEKSER